MGLHPIIKSLIARLRSNGTEMERQRSIHRPLDISERDPLHRALNELLVQVVQAMLNELGVSETLELMRPRMRYAGRVMARNFTSRLGLDGEGLEAIAFAPFCARCLIWGGEGRLTFYERGAINEFNACPVSHGPPEICIMMSHYCGEGICEEIDPNYEIVYTQHLTLGDASCVGVCKRRDQPGIEAGALGEVHRVVEELDIDEKEGDALSWNVESHALNIFLEAFLSTVSAERISQLLSSTFKSNGVEAGARLRALEREGGSAPSSLSILLTWGEMLGQAHEVKEVGEVGREITLSGCVFCHSPMVICELMESFVSGTISALDQDATVRYVKCKDASHEACRIVFQTGLNKDEGTSDPLVALKMRFVKGEVSEEEYRRKRAVLLER
jgi:hypothetical protein